MRFSGTEYPGPPWALKRDPRTPLPRSQVLAVRKLRKGSALALIVRGNAARSARVGSCKPISPVVPQLFGRAGPEVAEHRVGGDDGFLDVGGQVPLGEALEGCGAPSLAMRIRCSSAMPSNVG